MEIIPPNPVSWYDVRGYIYVLKVVPPKGIGPIKIGFSTKHPRDRLEGCATGCPYLIELLTFFPAYRWMEREIHERLEKFNTGKGLPAPAPSEWFWDKLGARRIRNRIIDGAASGKLRTPEDWAKHLRLKDQREGKQ